MVMPIDIRRFFTDRQSGAKALMVLILSLLLSGCYTTAALRLIQSGGGSPWWCQGTPNPPMRTA